MTKVFISYSHDNDVHQQRVYALADRLKNDGVDIILDRDCGPGGPDEGWGKWSGKQAEEANILLPVFTPEYRKCWDGKQMPNTRLGAIHELKVIYKRLYNAGSNIDFCRILTFEDDHRNSIPEFLSDQPIFDAQRDYTEILAWLRLKGAAPDPSQTSISLTWPTIPSEYPWPLADRKEQFAIFKDMIEQKIPQRIVLIEGNSNTGKTVLLNELINLAKVINLSAVKLDLKGCPNLNELFDWLASDTGPNILPAFNSASGSARKLALLKDLKILKTPLLVCFDTYQEIAPDIADWLESQFLTRIDQAPGLLVLIAGQPILSSQTGKPLPDPARYPGFAISHLLKPIRDQKYWREYVRTALKSDQITEDHIEMLIHIYDGDPGQTSATLKTFAGKKDS